MKMNLPNRLTMLRVLMIPVFVVFMLLSTHGGTAAPMRAEMSGTFRMFRYLACAVFCVASLTDFLDGKIARSRHLVTDFGKFMDPLADKLLVCSALILLTGEGSLSAVVVLIIIAREFIISGFRLIAADHGIVIAASWWGKIKTAVQMIMSLLLIFHFEHPVFRIIDTVFIYLALVLTVVSLIDYIYKNREVMKDIR